MSVATDAEAPFWDAFVVGASLTAQFGLARKWLQSWWFWIAVDLMAIPLFASRGLHLTAILYGVFLAMAVVGALRWSRVSAARVAV